MGSRQLWVFRVTGGDAFDLQVKGNPRVRHDGGAESVLRALCTRDQADELATEMRRRGCRVETYGGGETPEQKEERRNVMAVLGGERAFPCVRCPECAWFDPHIHSLCGAGVAPGGEGWDDDAVEGAMSNPRHRDDLDACPLRREAIH